MSNEYDYSGLYNHTSDGQPAQPQSSQPEQGGYPNVGSSGMNTANTARTDYSGNGASPNPQQDPNGYTSSFSGGNGNNSGYNGYSYSSAPQQPPVPQKKKPRKMLLRVLAGVGAVALGFGGGFGGGRRTNPNAPQRGESIRMSIAISFEEAAFGCEKAVTVERYETCDTCHGNGCAPGTSPEVCPDCHGTGTVQVRRQTPMGV